jgi:glycosyltransferase involved in cell wall biosynthesis
MKILFTAPRYHTNQHYPVKALLNAGHEVAFFALRRGGSEEHSMLIPKIFGYSRLFRFILRLKGENYSDRFVLRFGFPPVRQFLHETSAFKPIVVIIRDPNTAYGFLAILATKAIESKVILYTQGPKYRNMRAFERTMRSLFVALLDAQWITPVLGSPGPCSNTLDRIHYLPFVIAPGTPPEKKLWFQSGLVHIMTVGKFEPRKNHMLILKAIRELAKTFRVHLTIVGECTSPSHHKEFERIKNSVDALGLNELVEIKVNLKFSFVRELYDAHDLFVLPSSSEPAAVSILEAMAQSLPVICSDSNGTKCYIEIERNGYVFHTDDLQDLIAKMHLIIEDRERLIEMGRQSYQLVLERHLPERYAENISRIVSIM